MTQLVNLVALLLCLGLMCPVVTEIFMDKLASRKLCAADDCVYTISLARAEEDYNAPDCRFINIKKGQLIYVYSKLVKEDDSGEFWAGSVRRDSCVYEQTRSRLTCISVKKWMLMLSYCGF
uniref:Otoraplin n=1 Tax=Accipiter nisus TaxID=211598 RepID=A0A8B9MPK1_9AVES